ncbi:GTP cyclohydrolase I [Nocardioides terrae]|uniref:GTP cyclohydrolase 1 n=1 Tax=Nocardioides terrae TaxID=574651 RepID=A0A1I1LWX2_9ACTN|nr:GTP cyclohydrolase I [Nocardioides terrae]SFC76972.1 GTP cyclohydrolase I [Nocardioides terrae]
MSHATIDPSVEPSHSRLRITHEPAAVDLVAAERAAADMLAALGLPIDGEDMFETPRRLVHAYAELLTVPEFDLTTFDNAASYDELVLVSDIPVRSLCEHHLLPFTGVAHVGYLPGERILGLSKFARTVDFFARRAQTQERLTAQIADHLHDRLAPLGVGVVIEAEHSCMSLRGARATGARTTTSTLRGRLREDAAARAEFLALARDGRSGR